MLSIINSADIYMALAGFITAIILIFMIHGKRIRIIKKLRCYHRKKGAEIIGIILIALILNVGSLAWLGLKNTREIEREILLGSDIVLVLDSTYSMLAPYRKNSKKTRINRMKEITEDILTTLELGGNKNRVTAIAFTDNAWTLIPYPTSDYRLLRRELAAKINYKNSFLKGQAGSNIGIALLKGALAFPEEVKGEEKRSKIIIIMSDGEPDGDLSGIQKLITDAVSAYTDKLIIIGIGDPEDNPPLPLINIKGGLYGQARNKSGHIRKSKPDFKFLKRIQERSGGIFLSDHLLKSELNDKIKNEITEARRTGKFKKEKQEKNYTIILIWLYTALLIILAIIKLK